MVSHSCADGGLPWGVDQLWKGHFLPGRMSFLGLQSSRMACIFDGFYQSATSKWLALVVCRTTAPYSRRGLVLLGHNSKFTEFKTNPDKR